MGRKVHPYGFRLGGIKDWRARWYAGRRQFKDLLHEDIAIRNMVMDQVNQNGQAGVSDVERSMLWIATTCKPRCESARSQMMLAPWGSSA